MSSPPPPAVDPAAHAGGAPPPELALAQRAYDEGRFGDALAAIQWLDADDPQCPRERRADLWRLRCLANFRVGEVEPAADAALSLMEVAEVGDERLRAARFDALGVSVVAAGELARFDQALAHLREMLSTAARLGGLAEHVRARGTAANAFALLGDPWAAQRLLSELIGLFQGFTNEPRLEAQVRGNHASVCVQVARMARAGGDGAASDDAFDLAEASIARTREIAAATGEARIAAFADVHAAECALLRARGREALALLGPAVAQAEARGLPAHLRQLRLLEAEALLVQGEAPAALHRLAAVAASVTPRHELAVRIRLHALLHDAHLHTGAEAAAREHLARARGLEALRHFRQLHAQSRFARTRLELEHLYRYRDGAPR